MAKRDSLLLFWWEVWLDRYTESGNPICRDIKGFYAKPEALKWAIKKRKYFTKRDKIALVWLVSLSGNCEKTEITMRDCHG